MKIKQQGTILLASLMMIVIFTMLAFVSANRGKVNQQLTGSNQRYSATFEAAEITMRRASALLDSIEGREPFYSQNVTRGARVSALSNMDKAGLAGDLSNEADTNAFIWKACSASGSCEKDYSAANLLDATLWDNTILTRFNSTTDAPANSHMLNVRTYTIIEELLGTTANIGKGCYGSSTLGCAGGNAGDQIIKRYLITVKASGFPPDLRSQAVVNYSDSRENVVIQTIKNHVYNP